MMGKKVSHLPTFSFLEEVSLGWSVPVRSWSTLQIQRVRLRRVERSVRPVSGCSQGLPNVETSYLHQETPLLGKIPRRRPKGTLNLVVGGSKYQKISQDHSTIFIGTWTPNMTGQILLIRIIIKETVKLHRYGSIHEVLQNWFSPRSTSYQSWTCL